MNMAISGSITHIHLRTGPGQRSTGTFICSLSANSGRDDWGRLGRFRLPDLEGGPKHAINTRHLLTISFDAKGLPVSLFTVNSWVTGDLMLSAETTAQLLENMVLATGHNVIDAVLESLVQLYYQEIRELLAQRDKVLWGHHGKHVLASESLEILSMHAIDVDAKLRARGVL